MNCGESEVLVHALIDGELDAGHASEVEAHAATCSTCAAKLETFRAMRSAMAQADLKETAPASLYSRRRGDIVSAPTCSSVQILAIVLRRPGDRHGALGSCRDHPVRRRNPHRAGAE